MHLFKKNTAQPSVGIPRGLPYHRFGVLWQGFFKALQVPYKVSAPTTAKTLEAGTDRSTDETCLAMKLYLGHVDSLVGKCDRILVPRVSNFGRNRVMCPRFEALYDVVRNIYRESGQEFLTYEVDLIHGISEEDGFVRLGKELGFSAKESKRAYQAAKKEEKEAQSKLSREEGMRLKTPGLKVLLVGHSYVLEDAYIGAPIADFLQRNEVQLISAAVGDREGALKYSQVFSPTCKWEMNRELLGNLALKRKLADGMILLSTFPCGSDAMVNDLVVRQLEGVPVLNLVLDSQSGMAGIETRLESFIDIIKFKRGLM